MAKKIQTYAVQLYKPNTEKSLKFQLVLETTKVYNVSIQNISETQFNMQSMVVC